MTEQRIFRCALCGNRTVHDIISERVIYSHDEEFGDYASGYTLVFSYCKTCREEGLYTSPDEGDEIPLWPKSFHLGDSVPRDVEEIYVEANAVRLVSPNAFAVLIRKALEAICKEQGAAGHSLAAMLQDLITKKSLPSMVQQIARATRLIGNLGAHYGSSAVSKSQVEAVDEFFLGLIEYIYTAPARLARFDKLLQSLPQEAGGSEEHL